MSRRVAFRQADLERTVRALKAVGETIGGVHHFADGSFRVLTASEAANHDPQDALDALATWERENGHRAA